MRGLSLADPALVGRERVLGVGPALITWANAVWAGDPLWTNPGDGNAVDSMRNLSGGGDPAMTGGNRPTYRASTAAYNNKPTVQFVRTSSQRLDFNTVNINQPVSLVVVGNTSGSVGGEERLIGNGGAVTGGLGDTAAHAFVAQSSTALVGSAADGNPHLFRGYLNGASSVLAVDGTTQATGDAGVVAVTRFTLGSGSNATPAFNNALEGHIAFAGMAVGDVTTRSGWTAFKAWVASEYGLTIA